ncbi:MAG: hypothetical protein CSB49_05635 [Proteobacteria bacterium]|nr:MAG: hypothetical protein CSB49_05635 [Pseudomonadota bacterium]
MLVLPEDDHSRQFANGFILHAAVAQRSLQILPPAGGWMKAVERLEGHYFKTMERYPERRLVLVIDFDGEPVGRRTLVQDKTPTSLRPRVFVLGAYQEPEVLCAALGQTAEQVGEGLARGCAEQDLELWQHERLRHNEGERQRLDQRVRGILFPGL